MTVMFLFLFFRLQNVQKSVAGKKTKQNNLRQSKEDMLSFEMFGRSETTSDEITKSNKYKHRRETRKRQVVAAVPERDYLGPPSGTQLSCCSCCRSLVF